MTEPTLTETLRRANDLGARAMNEWGKWKKRALIAEATVEALRHTEAVDKTTIQDLEFDLARYREACEGFGVGRAKANP